METFQPNTESSLENSPESETLTDNQRERLMQYLRESSEGAVGENLETATSEEQELAQNILALGLVSGDIGSARHNKYSDSNYTPDVIARTNAFEEIGITDPQIHIRRHNIDTIPEGGVPEMHLKIINLIRRTEGNADHPTTETNIEGSVLFFGKVTHIGQQAIYLNLTDEDLENVRKFIHHQREINQSGDSKQN